MIDTEEKTGFIFLKKFILGQKRPKKNVHFPLLQMEEIKVVERGTQKTRIFIILPGILVYLFFLK